MSAKRSYAFYETEEAIWSSLQWLVEEQFRNFCHWEKYFVDQFDNEKKTNTYLTLFVELISRWTANKTYSSEQKDSSVTTRKEQGREWFYLKFKYAS